MNTVAMRIAVPFTMMSIMEHLKEIAGKDPIYINPELIEIPEGEFTMGSNDGNDNEKPECKESTSEYEIGKYPTTNVEYLAYVLSKGVDREFLGDNLNHPVVNVSWYDAVGYVEWLSECTGKKITLPSEIEWEKAARGTDGRKYPWGDKFDKTRCNTQETGAGTTTPVNLFPNGVSPYGAYDMAGNVWEWTSDEYKERRKG